MLDLGKMLRIERNIFESMAKMPVIMATVNRVAYLACTNPKLTIEHRKIKPQAIEIVPGYL